MKKNIELNTIDDLNSFFNPNKEVYLSQKGIARFLKIAQPSVSNWVKKYKKKYPEKAELILLKGFDFYDLLEIIKDYVFSTKVTKEVKNHCIHLLVSFINIEKNKQIFNTLIKEYFTQFLNRPSENLIKTHNIQSGDYVYLIINLTTGNLKIGYSNNPYQRFKSLQQSTDCDLQLLAFFEGNEFTEQILLCKFSDYQIKGEWFKPVPEIYEVFGLNIDNVVILNTESA